MNRWVTFVFSVFGAFMLFGLIGAGLADSFNLRHIPVAGFLAAFGVVALSYISAPLNPRVISVFVFLVGTLVAWFLLKDMTYSESTHFMAKGKPTYLPFFATVSGGILCLVIIFIPFRHRNETD